MALPNPNITPIPDNDPDAVPELWNVRYEEIDENCNNLDGRTEGIEFDLAGAKGEEDTLTAKVAGIVSTLADVDGRVGDLELDSAIAVSEAVKLDWLYRNLRMALELWAPNWTLLSGISLTVTQAVAGDNSVDVDDTSLLVVGQEYVIDDETNREAVVVDEILTANRFTAVSDLSHSYSSGLITRTNFTGVTEGTANAQAGRVYYAGPLNLGADDVDKAVVIRREDNDAVVRVYYQDATHTSWTEAPWKWRREISSGVVDVEYLLPARDDLNIKIECEAGGEDNDVDIHFIAGVHADTGLAGTHHPPETPVNSSPADAATDISEIPTLTVAGYTSLVGAGLWASQVQITTTSGDYSSPVYDSGTVLPGSVGISIPAGTLGVSTEYFWRMRVQDVEESWSQWSIETSFTTDSSFSYVVTPQNQSPGANALDIPEQPTLSAGAFNVVNFDPISLSDGAADKWTNSTTTPGEFFFSAAGGPTAKPMAVYANSVKLTAGALGSLANNEWAWGDQDTIGSNRIYVKLAVGDPDAQAADYIQCGESHDASQWQIRSAVGAYTSPIYDSGSSADLTSHVVPAEILAEGENSYYFRTRYRGENIGWSEWSTETQFTTLDMFAVIVGIAQVTGGGGAGTWQRIDAEGNSVFTDAAFFNNHPTYNAIQDVTIDGQSMVKIPKFYYKRDSTPVGGDVPGKKGWWISNEPATGFELHPAFMDAGSEIDQIYVGKYECTNDGGTEAGSVVGVAPLVLIDFDTMKTRCTARNTGGVEGFHLWTIYELGAIQMLCLIENGGPDVQATIGAGNTAGSSAANTGSTNAEWRGIYELWGNCWHMVDGLRFTDSQDIIEVFDRDGDGTYVSTGFVRIGETGWPTSMNSSYGATYDLRDVFVPATIAGGSADGTYGDRLISSYAGTRCLHGGDWYAQGNAGLFSYDWSKIATNMGSEMGGRLAKR